MHLHPAISGPSAASRTLQTTRLSVAGGGRSGADAAEWFGKTRVTAAATPRSARLSFACFPAPVPPTPSPRLLPTAHARTVLPLRNSHPTPTLLYLPKPRPRPTTTIFPPQLPRSAHARARNLRCKESTAVRLRLYTSGLTISLGRRYRD